MFEFNPDLVDGDDAEATDDTIYTRGLRDEVCIFVDITLLSSSSAPPKCVICEDIRAFLAVCFLSFSASIFMFEFIVTNIAENIF